jgi:hypothetical protein
MSAASGGTALVAVSQALRAAVTPASFCPAAATFTLVSSVPSLPTYTSQVPAPVFT